MVHDNDIRSYGNMMGVSKIVLIEARRNGNYRDFSVLDIERGVILYSAHINLDYILENILLHNNLPLNVQEEQNASEQNIFFDITVPSTRIFANFGSTIDNEYGVIMRLGELENRLGRTLTRNENHREVFQLPLANYPDSKSNTVFEFVRMDDRVENSWLMRFIYSYDLINLNISDKHGFLTYTIDLFNKAFGVSYIYSDGGWYRWNDALFWAVDLRLNTISERDFLEVWVLCQSGR